MCSCHKQSFKKTDDKPSSKYHYSPMLLLLLLFYMSFYKSSFHKSYVQLLISAHISVPGAEWVKNNAPDIEMEKVALQWSSLAEPCSIQKRSQRRERSQQLRYWKTSTIRLSNKMLPLSPLLLLIFSATGRSLFPDSDHPTISTGASDLSLIIRLINSHPLPLVFYPLLSFFNSFFIIL